MTGSISDAEDIVQDAFLGLTRAEDAGTVVESPKAYLATATTRHAINHLKSARVRREAYVGAWLPEPLVAGIVGKSEQNCRQIFARARQHLGDRRPRFERSRAESGELACRFFAAAAGGELNSLLALLAPDVVFVGDGGGKALAVREPGHHGPVRKRNTRRTRREPLLLRGRDEGGPWQRTSSWKTETRVR